jgi:hypothetical protein
MTIRDASGDAIADKTALEALTTTVTQPTVRKFTEDIYETFTGTGRQGEEERRLLFKAGVEVPQSAIDALYPVADITSIEPTGGAAAGGTSVTITGKNLLGATGATIGGVAITNFDVVDAYTITGNAGAHAAGAVDVVVQHPDGNATEVGAYTYA